MHTSSETAELDKALAQAQAEFPKIIKDAENPFFKSKYMDLAGLINAVQPVLGKFGLAIRQHLETDATPVVDDQGEVVAEHQRLFVCVITRLSHLSGQYEESTLRAPLLDPKPQTLGSASTYLRRYALQSILRVAADDDDGNAASLNERWDKQKRDDYIQKKKQELSQPQPSQTKPLPQPRDLTEISEQDIAAALKETFGAASPPPSDHTTTISKAQQQLLHVVRRKLEWEDAAFRDFLGSHGFEHTAEIPITKFGQLLDEVDPEGKEHKKTMVKRTPK